MNPKKLTNFDNFAHFLGKSCHTELYLDASQEVNTKLNRIKVMA